MAGVEQAEPVFECRQGGRHIEERAMAERLASSFDGSGASSDDLIRARDAAAQELRREIASLVAVDRLESRFASGISEAPTGKSSCLHEDATDRGGVDSLGRQGIVGTRSDL